MQIITLSEFRKYEALSDINRYYTWLALGKPMREATVEECFAYYIGEMSKGIAPSDTFEVLFV